MRSREGGGGWGDMRKLRPGFTYLLKEEHIPKAMKVKEVECVNDMVRIAI